MIFFQQFLRQVKEELIKMKVRNGKCRDGFIGPCRELNKTSFWPDTNIQIDTLFRAQSQ